MYFKNLGNRCVGFGLLLFPKRNVRVHVRKVVWCTCMFKHLTWNVL